MHYLWSDKVCPLQINFNTVYSDGKYCVCVCGVQVTLDLHIVGTIINPWRACTARVTVVVVCVCLSVCLSVPSLAKASLGSTLRQRYVQHLYRLFSVLTRDFSKKTFRSKVMA